MKNHVLLTEAYLETKALIDRAKAISDFWAIEWRMKDFIKSSVKDGFSKEDVQLLITIIMNEQWTAALDEINEEKLNTENN
jgi:hypothetical protein